MAANRQSETIDAPAEAAAWVLGLTIESSKRVARIGALIERAQPASYDYRPLI